MYNTMKIQVHNWDMSLYNRKCLNNYLHCRIANYTFIKNCIFKKIKNYFWNYFNRVNLIGEFSGYV